jgi:hypothetical protein
VRVAPRDNARASAHGLIQCRPFVQSEEVESDQPPSLRTRASSRETLREAVRL